MKNKKIFIVGSGIMGRGIAQVSAQSNYEVFLSDINKKIVEDSIEIIEKGLKKQVLKGKITNSRIAEILKKITPVETLEKCAETELIIEAISEDLEKKQSIFKILDELASPEIVLASNTTSCSITEIAAATKNPERVVGMHFFNPAFIMPLVEIMPGLFTAKLILKKTKEIALQMGKEPVILRKEGPAGITSRVLSALLNEAVWVFHEGISTIEEIDKAIIFGCNHKMGPFALIDLIGIDIHLAKTKMLYKKTGDPRYRPCYFLEQMVSSGRIGKKVGKGFYDYTKNPPEPITLIK